MLHKGTMVYCRKKCIKKCSGCISNNCRQIDVTKSCVNVVINLHQNVVQLTKGLGNVSKRAGQDFFSPCFYI